MGFPDVAWLAWPWVGLGGAVVLFIVLFATDWFRGDSSRGRWHDAAWLAWLPVPVYLLHVFEEYGLHVTEGQFDLVTSFVETGVDAMFGGIPLALFPEVNILLIYVTFPIAAFLGRRHPIVGFMPYGFMLVNGLTHIGGTLRAGGNFLATPGNFTGLIVFIPLFIWFCYACRKDRLLSAKGTALAIVAGVVQHIGVFSAYAVNMLLGHTAAIVWTPFMCCLGIALGLLFGRRREGAR